MSIENIIKQLTPIKQTLIPIGGVSVVFIIIFGLYTFNFHGSLSNDQTTWGTFGDYIGGTLNPILSFFSLIALLRTIALQSKELELTREELSNSALVQKETINILSQQSKTLATQQFESTFFSLLNQHNILLFSLSNSTTNTTFTTAHNEVFGNTVTTINDESLENAKKKLSKYNDRCGHYFRVLYQLLKFIATNCPDSKIGSDFEENKILSTEVTTNEKMYSNIVRSQISSHITQLLAVNCYCKNNEDIYWKYRLLIERYAFLEHMPFNLHSHNEQDNPILLDIRNNYKSAAFGQSTFLESSKQFSEPTS